MRRPIPKWVVAVGDCARDGGIFAGSYAVVGGVSEVVPVDLHIRGCPPPPEALLKACWRCSRRNPDEETTPGVSCLTVERQLIFRICELPLSQPL